MVPFEAVPPAAAQLGAHGALEARRPSELQGRPQLGGDVAAEVFDGADPHPVVEDGLYERVPAELSYPLDRQRPAAYGLAHLVWVGMAPPVGTPKSHTSTSSVRPGRASPSPDTAATKASAAYAAKGSASPELRAALRRRSASASRRFMSGTPTSGAGPCDADHPVAVSPVAQFTQAALALVELARVAGSQGALPGDVAQGPQPAPAGYLYQLVLGAWHLGLGTGHLVGLGERELACQKRLLGLGTALDSLNRLDR